MAGNPAEPPPSGQRVGPDEHVGPDERVGPVAIARHVKDDGRALILYTREEPPPA